jgi:hypothetical protein
MNIKFTKHAEDQMKERGISKDEVINTIKYPEKTLKETDRYYAQKKVSLGTIEVVYVIENYIKVITVYPI